VVALGIPVIIQDLLVSSERRHQSSRPEADAFEDLDALLETALLDVRLDMVNSAAWLLFDCRGAVHIALGNTAVVGIHGVAAFRWQADARGAATWRAVLGWESRNTSGKLLVSADVYPEGRLEIEGRTGEFFVGNVPGLDHPPPDFTKESDSVIRSGLASWTSEFVITGSMFLDRTDST
jgi:hypothetical protein